MYPPGLVTHLLLLLGLISSAAPVWAESVEKPVLQEEGLGEEGELRRAISLYDSGQYAACVDTFQQLLDPESRHGLRSPSKVESALVYYGSCLIGVGRTPEAEGVFRRAILDNPQMKTPDSLLFPEAVVELFLRVREAMMDEIRRAEQKRMQDAEARANREVELRQREQARVARLTKLAENETLIEHRERWLTFVPYGVGQFENESKALGWFFLGSEAAATTVLISSLYLMSWYGSKTDDLNLTRQEQLDLHAAQDDAYLAATISSWSFAFLFAAGVVEANISFVPETRVQRPRQLPKELRQLGPAKRNGATLSFAMAPLGEGGWSGNLVGTF